MYTVGLFILSIPVVYCAAFICRAHNRRMTVREYFCLMRQEKNEAKRRNAELKRLIKQMEIGDPIFIDIVHRWHSVGADKSTEFEPFRNSNFSGAYRITIGQEKVAEIIVDLRWPKDQQIFISCEYFGVFSDRSRFDVFSVLDGKKFIRKKLIPAIFPKA